MNKYATEENHVDKDMIKAVLGMGVWCVCVCVCVGGGGGGRCGSADEWVHTIFRDFILPKSPIV